MQLRSAAALDLATGALILSGAGLMAASIIAAVLLLTPRQAPPTPAAESTLASVPPDRPAAALLSNRVATVLTINASAGAGAAARTGDHVDILGYFSQQSTGSSAITRVLLQDIPVLGVERSGSNISLLLSVPQASALLLEEAQALGARPYIALRPLSPMADLPPSFSDADLAGRISNGAF